MRCLRDKSDCAIAVRGVVTGTQPEVRHFCLYRVRPKSTLAVRGAEVRSNFCSLFSPPVRFFEIVEQIFVVFRTEYLH
jgi:hypothetical protein